MPAPLEGLPEIALDAGVAGLATAGALRLHRATGAGRGSTFPDRPAPFRIDGDGGRAARAPLLGEDTAAVLAKAVVDAADLPQLRAAGVIWSAAPHP